MATNVSASTTDRRTVVGVFDGPNHAETALNRLKGAGFRPEQVSVVAQDKGETQQMVENTGMGSGTATGAVTGARPLYVVYIPFSTAESTGLSATPARGTPWIMFAGTPKAHIMFTPDMR